MPLENPDEPPSVGLSREPRHRRVPRALAAVPLVALMGVGESVRAQALESPEAQATALIELARRQLDLACESCSPSAALDLANRAYQLRRSASALQYVAIAEKRLGRYLEAEQHLLGALSFTQGPALATNERDAALRTLDDVRLHLVDLTVRCSVADAEVFVNDRSRGRTDADGSVTVRLLRGAYDVRVVLPDETTLRRVGVDASGSEVTVVLDSRADVVGPSTTAADVTAVAAEVESRLARMEAERLLERERAEEEARRIAQEEDARRHAEELAARYERDYESAVEHARDMVGRRRWAWSFTTVGVLSMATGGYIGGTIANEVENPGLWDIRPHFGPTTGDPWLSRTTASLGLGSFGFATWIVAFPIAVRARPRLMPTPPDGAPTVSVMCAPGGAGIGVSCGGRF